MKKRLRVVFGLLSIGIIIIFFVFQNQEKDIENLTYQKIDMNQIKDGDYEGYAETMLIKATVQVTVKDHRLKKIEIIKHDHGLGGEAEKIVEKMIEKNNYQVDVVSGATMSSYVIQSAVSQALEKGIENDE